MLGDKNVMADVAVKDLNSGKDFYVGKLGLKVVKANEREMILSGGNGRLHVYQSDNAGTNKATTCTFTDDKVENAVEELKSMGIDFEHYDLPGVARKGDVHVMGNLQAAWFKDPDGNVICITNGLF